MAWFTDVLIRSTHKDGHLSYVNLFFFLFLLLVSLSCSFILIPFITCAFICIAYIYKKRNNIPDDILSNSWHELRHVFACFMIKLGEILHDHEIIGMQHIPEGPGIIVFYHGTFVVDYFFLVANLYTQRRKLCITVTEKTLFIIPGSKTLFEAVGSITGSKAECLQLLKNGHLLAIAPGGGREAIFSDNYYNLIWGKRIGFAQLALEAKVPIIPMFTQNIQEAFRGFGRIGLVRWLYEKTRMICIPIFGEFPVKLRTYLGEPIPYDPNITAVELAEKTKTAIENLRDRYQKIPGNLLSALAERFNKHCKDD